VQSRESLLDHVWASKRDLDPHRRRPTSNASAKKSAAARDYIETVRGVGYRFADAPLVEAS